MVENSELRESKWIWALRWVQLLFTLIALGVFGNDIASWHGAQCNTPHKLAFNTAVASLSLPLVLYLLPATGRPGRRCIKLPWNQWMQVFLDGFFFILWIAAVAQSNLNCNDVCAACPDGHGDCPCGYAFTTTRRQLNQLLPRLTTTTTSGSSNLATSVVRLGLRVGFSLPMLFAFLFIFLVDVRSIHRFRKQGSAGSRSPAAAPNVAGGATEAGKEPMTNAYEVHEYGVPTEQTAYGYNAPVAAEPYEYGQVQVQNTYEPGLPHNSGSYA